MQDRHPNLVALHVLQLVRQSKPCITPVIFIRHIPSFSQWIRPLNMIEALSLSKKMFHEGYRQHEPITITQSLFNFDGLYETIPSYVLAGNHRVLAARDSLNHLVYAHVVTAEHVTLVYHAVKQLDEYSFQSTKSRSSAKKCLFRALKFLVIVANTRDISPSPYSPLEQAVILRTLVYSDPGIPKPMSASKKVYGGYEFLQERFFGGKESSCTDAHNRNHFLHNSCQTTRHTNRLLLGCMRLIETYLSHPIPFLGSQKSVLDILVLWENNDLMPEFRNTYICHAGELTSSQLCKIIELCAEGLRLRNHMVGKNGALKYSPLCTQFVKGIKNGRLQQILRKMMKEVSREGEKVGRNDTSIKKRILPEQSLSETSAEKRKRATNATESGNATLSASLLPADNNDDLPASAKCKTRIARSEGSMDLKKFKDCLKENEKKEQDLLREVQRLRKEVQVLKAEKLARASKSSGTRRLSTRQLPFQLEVMSMAALAELKKRIEERLNAMTKDRAMNDTDNKN